MKILRYELKKIFHQRSVIFMGVILLISNLILGFFAAKDDAPVTDERKYPSHIDSILYQAEINESLIEDKASENALYHQKLLLIYGKTYVLDVSGEVRGYSVLLSSPYPYISALIFMVWFALRTAHVEISANQTLLLCKEKRCKISITKLTCLLCFSFVSTLLYCLCYGLGVLVLTGFEGGNLPIQSISTYMKCPYLITVQEGVLLRILFAGMACAVYALAIFLFAFLLRRFVLVILLTLLMIGADFFLTYVNKDIFSFGYNINLRTVFTGEYFTRYSGMNCGVFLSQIVLIALALLFFVVMLTIIDFLVFCTSLHIHAIKSRRQSKNCIKQKKEHGLLYYESRKMLGGRTIFIAVILISVQIISLFMTTKLPDTAYDNVYRNYLNEMEALSFEEQVTYVQNEKLKSHALIAEAEQAENNFFNGVGSHEVYTETAQKAGVAKLNLEVLREIEKSLQSLGVVREKGIDAKLSYTKGFSALFAGKTELIGLFAIMLIMVPYLTIDYDNGYEPVLQAHFHVCKREKLRYEFKKLLFAWVVSVFILLIFSMIELLYIHISIGFCSCSANAIDSEFPHTWYSYSFGKLMLFYFGLIMAGTYIYICLSKLLSRIMKKGIILMFVFFILQIFFLLCSYKIFV